MGYQESYVYPKKQEDFEKLVDFIKEKGENYSLATAVAIIEFTKNHYPFKKGDKAVYYVGERFSQSNIYAKERILHGCDISCNIRYTEDVAPCGIWEDATPNNKYHCIKTSFWQ
jgi:hypothetical protein